MHAGSEETLYEHQKYNGCLVIEIRKKIFEKVNGKLVGSLKGAGSSGGGGSINEKTILSPHQCRLKKHSTQQNETNHGYIQARNWQI